MEATVRTPATASLASRLPRLDAERGAAWLLAFLPTIYLALSGGGYDVVARSQVAIVLWWILLVGALVGVLPRRRIGAAGWVALALLGGFLILTWIAVGWTQSEERTLTEVGRVSAYLGVLALGFSLIAGGDGRSLLNGLACAIGLVALLAVLSKLAPSWFPTDVTAKFYATPRLRYPFDYSDGVGEFVALGLPLLLAVATGGRTLFGRAAAVAGLPIVALALAMTVSRGGILAAAAGLFFFFVLVHDRLSRLPTSLLAAAGSAGLVAALLGRPGLRDSITTGPAGQRHSMLVLLIVVCLAVAAVHAAGSLLATRFLTGSRAAAWNAVCRRGDPLIAGSLVGALVIGIAIVIATGAGHHLWQEFKRPTAPRSGNSYLRLLSVAGSHRYQYWQVAAKAFDAHPWKGIGPGTFEFYWAQHQTLAEFVRNAHSLWIETLAELGIPGLVLIAGFFLLGLVGGSARGLAATDGRRLTIATAAAGIAAFCAAAAFDWIWQLGVIPLVAMLLVAVALGPTGDEVGPGPERGTGSARLWSPALAARLVLVIAAIPALWAIARPLATTVEVRASQSEDQRGQFQSALSDALTAQHLEPGAATPRLQRALVLEQLGDVGGAAAAIGQAETREPTNWQIWLVASRIATEQNRPGVALADYRHARSLNPTSPLFKP